MRISDWSSDVCSSDLFLNLGSACFQDLAGVFEVRRRCDGRTLLDSLDRLDQARRPGFQALQAGIQPFLVGLVVHGLVAQGYGDAEADQPEPQKTLHQHDGGRAPRSEERRVGKEGGSTCSVRWSP